MDKYKVLPSSAFGFICRTCLLHNELFLIDEVSWEGISLKEIILNWTSLDVEEYERLPKQMCNKCIKLMYQTYHFLSKCKSSEWTLKNIILKDDKDVQKNFEDLIVMHSNVEKEVTTKEEYINRPIDYTTKIKTDSDNVDNSILDSDNIHNSISDSDNDNSLAESESIDKAFPDCTTIDANNCSATSGNGDDTEIKTEISHDDDEMSAEPDSKETILDEIQSIKSDISKLRARNKIRLRQRMKVRLLNLRKKSRIKGPPYNCITCDAWFQTQEEVKSHRNDTHKKYYKFNCEYCDSKYQNMGHLIAHTRVHTGEKPYRCTTCGDCFSFKSVLKRHMVRHMEVKPHRCRYCHQDFTRKHLLDLHERKHTGKRLVCRYNCGMEFETSKSQIRHEKNRHPAPQNVPTSMTENGYQCDVCGKVLMSEKSLSAHVLLHGPRNFTCKTCQKAFTTNDRLLLHLKMTHESTMFSCHLCDNKYRQKSGLLGHLETQHQANNYYCDKCGKKFVYKSSLRDHMRLHTGDTKYQCKECLRVCTTKRRLESHMRSHTGERPFTCEVCGKSFAEQTNFHSHQKIHTREKSYACNVCEKLFLDFHSLKKHISVHI